MSKYIIELNDDVQIVQKVGVTNNGNAFSIGIYKDILEQYTPVDVEKIYDKASTDGHNRGLEDGKAQSERGCEGCKWEGDASTSSPCERCCNCYKNEWTAKDDKIEVGDVVTIKHIKHSDKHSFVVTKVSDESVWGVDEDGGWNYWAINEVIKTDKHFDIDKILEEMRT